MTESPRLAVLPGSFDPLTNGHVDMIERAARLFDRVIVAVLGNPSKPALFGIDERIAISREVFAGRPTLEAEPFDGLLVDFARRRRAVAVVRGLRGAVDFDYESQMAMMNRHLHDAVDTLFLIPAPRVAFISSSLVKEVAALGGAIDGLVPDAVRIRLERRRDGVGHRNA
jgi:pantetheine-phosphate adenylyltransferase